MKLQTSPGRKQRSMKLFGIVPCETGSGEEIPKKSPSPTGRLRFALPPLSAFFFFFLWDWVMRFKTITVGSGVVVFLEGRQIDKQQPHPRVCDGIKGNWGIVSLPLLHSVLSLQNTSETEHHGSYLQSQHLGGRSRKETY